MIKIPHNMDYVVTLYNILKFMLILIAHNINIMR